MTLTIKQTVTETGPATVEVVIELPDESIFREVYHNGNLVFPAFVSLRKVLQHYKKTEIAVVTTSEPLAMEYNYEYQNPNARLLMELVNVIVRNGLTVSIEYIQ
ncbi:hypothetical protein [Lysinibacillus sp. FSL W8-0992]|uniref:hypothetical protein n=1 Tax=Lysinibacillus sp. FSL W8-0992 TaxID=2954643 RepID=UPI0030F7B414